MDSQRIVILDHRDRRFVFRVASVARPAVWTVAWSGHSVRSYQEPTGTETLAFFRRLAEWAVLTVMER